MKTVLLMVALALPLDRRQWPGSSLNYKERGTMDIGLLIGVIVLTVAGGG